MLNKLEQYLLCTDLDRTLLPNGHQKESSKAREIFTHLISHKNIDLAYVSGRSLQLVKEAIKHYALPKPVYIICDVGSSIYKRVHKDELAYDKVVGWQTIISQDWGEYDSSYLRTFIKEGGNLKAQPDENQTPYKLSYTVTPSSNMHIEIERIQQLLKTHNINSSIIDSIDETLDEGLIDILPKSANKKNAITYIVDTLGYSDEHVFFSGDSGNDLDVLNSPYKVTLVANATEQVIERALSIHQKTLGTSHLYIAKGSPENGLNGNYSSGIAEGFMHYFPEFNSLK